MDATVLICTRDRAADLRATLASMARVRVPDGLFVEVVVVDNGSTDDTSQVIREANIFNQRVRYVRETAGGKSVGLNAGMRNSTGRAVIFTDDDVRFPPNWLAAMVDPILSDNSDVVAGSIEIAPHLSRPWMTSLHRNWLASTEGIDLVHSAAIVGANMAVSRSALAHVGGFDPRLGPGLGGLGNMEDTMLGAQLKDAGYRFCSRVPATVEHHFSPMRLGRESLLRAAAAHGRSLAYVAWTYWHWKLPLLPLRRWYYAVQAMAHRLQIPAPEDHATVHELIDEKSRAFFEQFAVERQIPAIPWPRVDALGYCH